MLWFDDEWRFRAPLDYFLNALCRHATTRQFPAIAVYFIEPIAH